MNIVLDSNILLHYRSFEDIPWQEELACDGVTLIFSAMVMEEIDKYKDQERGKIQKRAKAVSSRIGEILLDGKDCKYPLVFLESAYSTEEDKRKYHLDRSDNQILFDVLKSGLDKSNVMVVSNDTTMLIRAQHLGIKTHRLDDKYLLKEELSEEEKEARAVRAEYERIKKRMPRPRLEFEDGSNHIQFKRIPETDIEEVVGLKMEELRNKWPEKRVDEGAQNIMGYLFNTLTPEKVTVYNASRTEFLEKSEVKVRLEVQRDDYAQRMQKIVICVSNVGTASTGSMNIFLELQKGVKIYYKRSKKRISYEQPETPSFCPGMNGFSYINPLYGYSTPNVEMWDLDAFHKSNEFKEELGPLNHNIKHELFTFFVDKATCPNFQMSWFIADAELPDPVTGTLNVSFVE